MQTPVAILLGALLGGLVTGLVVWLSCRSRLAVQAVQQAVAIKELDELRPLKVEAEKLRTDLAGFAARHDAEVEQREWRLGQEDRLREAFESLAARTLQGNSETFLKTASDKMAVVLEQIRGDWGMHKEQIDGVVTPVREQLDSLKKEIQALEAKREGAYEGVSAQIRSLLDSSRTLSDTATNLSHALRSPNVKGAWGEMQLRRVVEMAGMAEHVDFSEQVHGDAGRPDMVIRMPNSQSLPVDAKTPMTHFLNASEAPDDSARGRHLDLHAREVKRRVQELAQRGYWSQFSASPEVVILFIPNDGCLSAALGRDPMLMEEALKHRVLLASPNTLFALLKAVAFGWQQQEATQNALRVADLGREIAERLTVFSKHLERVGGSLTNATNAYNQAVGSLESRVMSSARKLREMGISGAELPQLAAVEVHPRGLRPVDTTDTTSDEKSDETQAKALLQG